MESQTRELINVFISILYEALPFIILGAIIAGLLEELVPQRYVARVIPRSPLLAILLGGLLGLVFPMCECGIVAVMRRLLRKGLPLSACVCYMLAGPVINVIVMLSTAAAFSGMEQADPTVTSAAGVQLGSVGMTTFRVLLAYLVAVGTALVVEALVQRVGARQLLMPLAMPPEKVSTLVEDDDGTPRPWKQRLSNITETSLHDFVDITVFLILGAALSAGSRLFFKPQDMGEFAANYPVAIALMMGFAVLLCLCSEADAFVAASLRLLPPSAKLGFLVLGPMLDLKLYLMFTRVFRPRLIWTIVLALVVQVYVYCLITHWVLNTFNISF